MKPFKNDRLLNLYLEGNLPEPSYVVKTAQLKGESERLTQHKTELQPNP